MTRPLRRFGNIFVAGLLAALPLAATVAIVAWTVQTLYAWLGPGSAVGGLLARLGLGLGASEVAGYLLGLACVLALVFLLGLLVHTRMHGWLVAGVDTLVQQVPLVRNIYDVLRRFVDLVSQRDATGTGAMSPVWLYFGGRDGGGAAVLGLLSHAEPVLMRGQPYLGVLVPTAPVPVGGALVYVPQDWVEPAPVGVEGLTSIYVSMGVTAGQHLGPRQPDT